MVHALRLLLVTLFLTFAGSSGAAALTLENRAGEKLVIAPELSLLESPQAVPTHRENGGGYGELAADRLSFQSEDPIKFKAGDDNLSRYVFNNPLGYTDRTGRNPSDEEKELQVTINRQAGREFEITVQKTLLRPLNKSIRLPDGRIPDILDEDLTIIGEVKNVKYLSLTGQLRSYIAFARAQGIPFVLVLPEGTTEAQLSGPLLQELTDLGATIIFE